MPLHEAEALVLRHYSLSEADRIVVLLTRESGKLRGVAQGVKRPRSRLAGALEPLNHIQLQYYAREGADLCRISQCEIIHSYLGHNPTLERVYAFTYLAELAQEFVEENNASPLFFRLMIAALETGEKLGASEALVRYVELWSLKLNGWLPDYDYCSGCGSCVKDSGFYAHPDTGQIRCAACAARSGIRVSAAAAAVVRSAMALSPEKFASSGLAGASGSELERLTRLLLEMHLEKRLKSRELVGEMLRGQVEK